MSVIAGSAGCVTSRTATPKRRSPTRSSGFRVSNPMRISSANYTRMPKSTVAIWFCRWRDYASLTDFGEANDIFIENAVELGCAALSGALDEAGVTAAGRRPDHLDDRHRLCGAVVGRPHRRRAWVCAQMCAGCRCSASAASPERPASARLQRLPARCARRRRGAGVSRVVLADLPAVRAVGGHPGRNALFGDGAAAVVAVGERRAEQIGAAGPDVLDSRSHLYPDSQTTMGWNIGSSGFALVLSPTSPTLVERYLADDVTGFLRPRAGHRRHRRLGQPSGRPEGHRGDHLVLGLPDDALELTWRSLSEVGNLSSSSVLHVLRDTIAKQPPSGSPG